jgi:hypothetical protein
MFDVYLNEKRHLLIVKKGSGKELFGLPGRWRKSRSRVAKVSDEIRSAIQRQGYYIRKLSDARTRVE